MTVMLLVQNSGCHCVLGQGTCSIASYELVVVWGRGGGARFTTCVNESMAQWKLHLCPEKQLLSPIYFMSEMCGTFRQVPAMLQKDINNCSLLCTWQQSAGVWGNFRGESVFLLAARCTLDAHLLSDCICVIQPPAALLRWGPTC